MDFIRPLEWVFSWLSERPIVRADAHICTMPHGAFFVGSSGVLPQWEPHVDVEISFHKRRGGKVSIYEIASAVADGQALEPAMGWKPVELEGGGTPVEVTVALTPPSGEPLKAGIGTEVDLALLATPRRRPIHQSALISR